MKKFHVLLSTILLVTFIITNQGYAQSRYTKSQMRKQPIWIQMMEDPNANFYETVEAFKVFWEGKELPREAWESREGDTFERELGLEDKEKEREREREKKKGGPIEYIFEVKQFRGWYTDSKPWVQEDGHILSMEERQAIVDKQQAELKEVEHQNGKK